MCASRALEAGPLSPPPRGASPTSAPHRGGFFPSLTSARFQSCTGAFAIAAVARSNALRQAHFGVRGGGNEAAFVARSTSSASAPEKWECRLVPWDETKSGTISGLVKLRRRRHTTNDDRASTPHPRARASGCTRARRAMFSGGGIGGMFGRKPADGVGGGSSANAQSTPPAKKGFAAGLFGASATPRSAPGASKPAPRTPRSRFEGRRLARHVHQGDDVAGERSEARVRVERGAGREGHRGRCRQRSANPCVVNEVKRLTTRARGLDDPRGCRREGRVGSAVGVSGERDRDRGRGGAGGRPRPRLRRDRPNDESDGTRGGRPGRWRTCSPG